MVLCDARIRCLCNLNKRVILAPLSRKLRRSRPVLTPSMKQALKQSLTIPNLEFFKMQKLNKSSLFIINKTSAVFPRGLFYIKWKILKVWITEKPHLPVRIFPAKVGQTMRDFKN